MDFINRSAIVLRPKQPFLEWAKQDDAEGLAQPVFDALNREPGVYLVPDWQDPDERRRVLEVFWPVLFDAMLNGWVTDQGLWRENRTLEMFHEWFEVQTFDSVEDLYRGEAIEYLD